MKVGVYTDVHCAFTSSILPLRSADSRYTTRLDMIIDSFRFMYDTFRQKGVDCIVNCGDLFDSCQLRAEEISAMAEALSYGGDVPEYHVLGNHEVFDTERQFCSNALLSNYSYIHLITQPTKLANGISFLPYMRPDLAEADLPLIQNKILFSHIDIAGSTVTPQHVLESGVDPHLLKSLFGLVVNGHLHAPQKLLGCVHNIGASTSLSFSDNESSCPRFTIIDTDTLQMEFIDNPYAIRFIKGKAASLEDAKQLVASASPNSCVVRISLEEGCSRSAIQAFLDECASVKAYRLLSPVVSVAPSVELQSSTRSQKSTADSFLEFIDTLDTLEASKSEYVEFIKEIGGAAN